MDGNLAYQEPWREELIGGKVVAMAPVSAGHTYVADGISQYFQELSEREALHPFR